MDGTAYFLLLQKSVVLTDDYNVMVNSGELTVFTDYQMQQTMPHKSQYN